MSQRRTWSLVLSAACAVAAGATTPTARAGTPPTEPPPLVLVIHLPKSGLPQPPPPPILSLDVDTEPVTDYVTSRYEPAGLPLLGGNSDIGFMFGAAGTLTHFADGSKPYAWNMDVVVSTSVKGGTGGNGLGFAQQNYVWNWDVPNLLGGRLRLNPVLYYQRTVDQGYFGLGNASSAVGPSGTPRFFQYLDSELRAQQFARIALGKGYDLALVGTFRAEAPTAYPGTLLALDAATRNADGSPLLRGVQPVGKDSELGIAMLSGGIIYDSRDNEIFPRSGAFHQVGVKVAQGMPTDEGVDYGQAGGILTYMIPMFNRSVVLAMRAVADFQFGNVPFYDLFTGGVFQSNDMPGGSRGIRGVPSGRYLGRVKAIGNAELRSLPLGFRLFGQRFHMGGDVFFDAGRIWLDYTFRSPLDKTGGLGLKYGTGGGLYFLWGQAAIFRIDVAYSPDQVSENPNLPVGIYVEDGVMF